MMNKYLIIIALTFTVNSLMAQSVIKAKKTFPIQAATVVNGGNPYDLNSTGGALKYIENVILKDPSILNDAKFSEFNTAQLEESAIIFIRHGINGTALLLDRDSATLAKTDFIIKTVKKRQNDSITKVIKNIDSLEYVIKYKNEISETDYDNIIAALSADNKMIRFLSAEKISILKNSKVKPLLTEELELNKAALENSLNNIEVYKSRNTPSFEEGKDIVKMIIHKKNGIFSDYLLTTKKIMIVILGGADDLQKAEITIKNNKNYFMQSFEDLIAAIPSLKGFASELTCKVILINEKKIHPPSEIIIKKDSAKELSFIIHEKNIASFQIGVSNNKFQLNNFSISNGNLSIKPDATQKTNWKSNLYAILELHLPRDIDNFRPIYKTAFKGQDGHRTAGNWLNEVLLCRVGIYGGFKICDDPLSYLHAGFNFAITKELNINFGWTWANQIVPQITSVGNITSLNDALIYARRNYSDKQFSWGLSFAPAALISSFGSKKKSSD